MRLSKLLVLVVIAAWGGLGVAAGEDDESDRGFQRGLAAARRDLEAGKLVFWQPMPETFLMGEFRGGESKHVVEYFAALLESRYGVVHRVMMFHVGSPVAEQRWAAGYDRVMVAAIEKRFGREVLDKTWREAFATTVEQRATFLKLRAAAAATAPVRPWPEARAATRATAATRPAATQPTTRPVRGG
jgi:hypothetical protein